MTRRLRAAAAARSGRGTMTKTTWMWVLTGMMLAGAAIITISAVDVQEDGNMDDDVDGNFVGA